MKEQFHSHKLEGVSANAGSHWYEERKEIFSKAVDAWGSSSPTSLQRKRAMSAQAKQLNARDNLIRSIHMDAQKKRERNLSKQKSHISNLQLLLVQSIYDAGLMDPLAASAGAESGEEDSNTTIADQDRQMVLSETSPDYRSHYLQIVDDLSRNESLSAAVQELLDLQQTTLHGIGDTEFVISPAIMNFACEQKSFVNNGHVQFDLEHRFVCPMVPELKIDEKQSLDNGLLPCERLLGRYCRADIQSMSKYNSAVGYDEKCGEDHDGPPLC